MGRKRTDTNNGRFHKGAMYVFLSCMDCRQLCAGDGWALADAASKGRDLEGTADTGGRH